MKPGDDSTDDSKDKPKQDYIVEVLDIYFDGTFICVDYEPNAENVYMQVDLTIGDEVIGFTKCMLLPSDTTEDRETTFFNPIYEMRHCTEPTFSITAYVESIDATKTSTPKTVTFTNAVIDPVLNKETNQLIWQTNDIVEYYKIYVQEQGSYSLNPYPENTDGIFDINQVFEDRGYRAFQVRITPIYLDDIEPGLIYYQDDEVSRFIGKQRIYNLHYYNNTIYWESYDNYTFHSELDVECELTIVDGEETIHETLVFSHDEIPNYPYVPKHDNFSFSVSGGIDDPFMALAPAVSHKPTLGGAVYDVEFKRNSLFWKYQPAESADTDSDRIQYEIYQDGELIKITEDTSLSQGWLKDVYGDTLIEIKPTKEQSSYYFIPTSVAMFMGKTPDLEVIHKGGATVDIKFTNIDENALYYNFYESNYSFSRIKYEDLQEGFTYEFTPTEADTYYIYLEPVYDTNSMLLDFKGDCTVELLHNTKFIDAKLNKSNRWVLEFEKDQYYRKDIEYIITNSDGSIYDSGAVDCSKIDLELPEYMSTSYNTQSLTLKMKFKQKEPSHSFIELSPGYDEYIIKNLPSPDVSIANSTLTWDSGTDLPFENYSVEIYRKNNYGYSSIVASKIVEEGELDLTEFSFNAGTYVARVIPKANQDRLANGMIVLDGNKNFEKEFYKFNESLSYPTGTDTIKVEMYAGELAHKDYVDSISVKLHTDGFEETVIVNNKEELNIRSYLDELGISEISADITIIGKDDHINSNVKEITISAPKLTDFAISNENGTISWSHFLENSSYDYVLSAAEINSDDYIEIMSEEGILDCELSVYDEMLKFVQQKKNVDKSFSSYKCTITTNYDQDELSAQKNDAQLIMAPIVTEFEFEGLVYGVGVKSPNQYSFNMNKEFSVDPWITAKTTTGIYIGNRVMMSDGTMDFDRLAIGSYVIEFTNNVENEVFDEMMVMNLPYYHSLSILDKATIDGTFENFHQGEYLYVKNYLGDYELVAEGSTPATVDFKVSFGQYYYFNGQEVELTGNKYTLNLLQSDTITVKAEGTKGLKSAHSYAKYTYSNSKNFTFETYMPPRPEKITVQNGTLNIKVSHYDETATYTIYREYTGQSYTRTFTKDVNSAKDTFTPPTDVVGHTVFQPGEELVITIVYAPEGKNVEARIRVEYTVPFA
ncbi:MAG: hypothetical protein IKC49_00715 [Clostridia bacterium]|nr:hypothetical protein [Clostridia bacterium]